MEGAVEYRRFAIILHSLDSRSSMPTTNTLLTTCKCTSAKGLIQQEVSDTISVSRFEIDEEERNTVITFSTISSAAAGVKSDVALSRSLS